MFRQRQIFSRMLSFLSHLSRVALRHEGSSDCCQDRQSHDRFRPWRRSERKRNGQLTWSFISRSHSLSREHVLVIGRLRFSIGGRASESTQTSARCSREKIAASKLFVAQSKLASRPSISCRQLTGAQFTRSWCASSQNSRTSAKRQMTRMSLPRSGRYEKTRNLVRPTRSCVHQLLRACP